jgi:hypothetical protein
VPLFSALKGHVPGLLKVIVERESFKTKILSVPPEAPFVVVVAADGEEPYFPPPAEDPPAPSAAAYKHNRQHKRESPNPECALQCTVHHP